MMFGWLTKSFKRLLLKFYAENILVEATLGAPQFSIIIS